MVFQLHTIYTHTGALILFPFMFAYMHLHPLCYGSVSVCICWGVRVLIDGNGQTKKKK